MHRPCDLLVMRHGMALYRGRFLPCAIGRGGVDREKAEGDGKTLAGAFFIEDWLVRPDRCHLPGAYRLRHRDGWSDDPEDPAYNCAVSLPHPFRHERLWRADPLYDVIGVMSANRDPIVKGGGSALFVHCWRRPRYPTEGCIAFARPHLLWIASSWMPEARVIIRA
ncbi:MAG: L,D-transpeptidase family protein [Neomegalonema sp.]|nr:L,D-transpeptidase family protein [Neomegalonema sp.]